MNKELLSKFNSKNVSVVCLNSFGRASSAFFQGLLEGHPSIVTMPVFFSIKYDANNIRGMIKHFYNASFCLNAEKTYNMDAKSIIKYAPFEKYALEYLAAYGHSEKDFFFALHWAYACCMKLDVAEIKIILFQSHDFISIVNSMFSVGFEKIIFTVRDPRANYYSRFKTKGTLLSYSTLFEFFFYIRIKRKKPTFVVRHEDLHSNYPAVCSGLCKFLGIADHKSLYSSTMLGKPFDGINSMSTSKIKSTTPNKAFVEETWKKELPRYVIRRLERMYGGLIREFHYTKAKDSETTDFFYTGLEKVRIERISSSDSFLKKMFKFCALALKHVPFIGYALLRVGYMAGSFILGYSVAFYNLIRYRLLYD